MGSVQQNPELSKPERVLNVVLKIPITIVKMFAFVIRKIKKPYWDRG